MVAEFERNGCSIVRLENDTFGNTPLTEFLASKIFEGFTAYNEKKYSVEIKRVLTKLCELANSSESARQLLTMPNAPQANREYPIEELALNTPLMLLVKAGDCEAVEQVLPFYSTAEELMITTPRKNNVFHIVSITGQANMLKLLITRATELGADYRNQKNILEKTPHELVMELKRVRFGNFRKFLSSQLGGEEINKAPAAGDGDSEVVQFYQRVNRPEFSMLAPVDSQESLSTGFHP